MESIVFTVPGVPVAKGRPRVTRYGTYTPEKTLDYEKLVRLCWKRDSGVRVPDGIPAWIGFTAFLPIPKGTSKKRAATMDGTPHIKRPDTDNLLKAVLDALNECAYRDDSVLQIRECKKVYTTGEPHIDIRIEWGAEADNENRAYRR